MLFRNFNKPGAGISKDAPQKTGFALFLDIFIREFWTILILNFVFVFTCLPVITIGPSISAMNYVFAKMMRDEPVDAIPDYKRGFAINVKQGMFLGIFVTFVSCALVYSFYFYKDLLGYAAYAILALIIFFAIVNVYIFPLSANVSLPTKAVLKNSVLLFGICPKQTLQAFASNALIVVATLYFYNELCGIFYLLIGFSFMLFINCFFAYPPIEKHALSSNVTDIEITEEDQG